MESTANFINEDNFFEAFKGLYNDESSTIRGLCG